MIPKLWQAGSWDFDGMATLAINSCSGYCSGTGVELTRAFLLEKKKITICSGRKWSWKEHLTKTVWMENVRIQKTTQETKCWNAAQSQRAPVCDFISFRTILFTDPHRIVDMKIPMVILTCSSTKHCHRKLKLWGFKDVPTITFISHMPGF